MKIFRRLAGALMALLAAGLLAGAMAGAAFADEDEPGWRGVPLSESVAKAHENADKYIPGQDYRIDELDLYVYGQTVLPDGSVLIDVARDPDTLVSIPYRFEAEVASADPEGEPFACSFETHAAGQWLDGGVLVRASFGDAVDIHTAIDSLAQLPGVGAVCLCVIRYAEDPEPPSSAFADVPAGHWAFGAGWIQEASERGLMTGWEEDGVPMFGPDRTITRAEAVTVLWRLFNQGAGTDDVKWLAAEFGPFGEVNETEFVDVPESVWYTQALNWASTCHVVRGIGYNFYPNRPVTREEFAVLVWRFAEDDMTFRFPEELSLSDGQPSLGDWYSDWSAVTYGAEAVSWAHEAGLMTGYPDGTFGPGNGLTRAEAAKVFCLVHQQAIAGE